MTVMSCLAAGQRFTTQIFSYVFATYSVEADVCLSPNPAAGKPSDESALV